MLSRWENYLTRLKVTLLPYEIELAAALLELPFTAKVTQCRQSGKSFTMGLIIYFLAYVKHWDIVITAPKLDQTWYIMKHVHRVQNRIRAGVEYNNRYSISLHGRGSIQCLSGSETANVEGASAHLVVVDEHQDLMASHAAEIFIPMLSWHDGLYWSCGIGGGPASVAERDNADFVWVLPYQDVVKVKPNYIRLVELARAEMLPPEFAAHYECMALDVSGQLLIPRITAYGSDVNLKGAMTVIGIDWGKRLDRTVATVRETTPKATYITSWIAPTGSYDEQMKELVHWLKNDVQYNSAIAETNGVGDSCADFLIAAMQDPKGFETGVHGKFVTQSWITEQAKRVNRMALNETLLYNPDHELTGVFLKEVLAVEYEMMDSKHLKLTKKTHSDFISSLMLSIDEPGEAYV